jgi:S-adenosylmethionine:tRNA ribosyltransferase-isomerase
MDIELFDYVLPESYIAQYPLKKRDHSKLMILDRSSGSIAHDVFYDLDNYLRSGDILVINESRVTKCRLYGIKRSTGARIECFVLEKKGKFDFEVLLKPAKRLNIKDIVDIDGYFFEVISKFNYGRALVRFNRPAEDIFNNCGVMPIPPYIKSEDFNKDLYQTVYARREGSTASPTAGLHFTGEMIGRLKKKGIRFASLVLHIGPGTFRPVSSKRVEDHIMHREYYSIDSSQARMIKEAKDAGNRIIAVGTTSSRVLETIMKEYGVIKGSSGYTDIYIYPPYKFRAVDCIITNFHLPRSTLLIMVSAFAGRENIMKAYSEAIKLNYKFYSFGDCMFIK